MSRSRIFFALVVAASLVGAPTAAASPSADSLVISEAYGGGGNSGATYRNDFVELYNPTDAPVSVDGWSIQYRSAGGTSEGIVTPLTGSVPAKGHYLVAQAAGSGGSQDLPTPDATGKTAMSSTNFQVWLADTDKPQTPPSGNVTTGVIDFLGVGSAAAFETRAAAAVNNTTATARAADGADTNVNVDDFRSGAPSPKNSADAQPQPTPTPTATPTPTPSPEARSVTIAEIQGKGPESPLVGAKVKTKGVVTAAYPTGGFDGVYIQTPGPDKTPGASDAVFVYKRDFGDLKVGDPVTVTGEVKEFADLTEIVASEIAPLGKKLGWVRPLKTIPGTDCKLGGCPSEAELEVAREAVEGQLVLPKSSVTVTDAYDFGVTSASFFGEIGLAVNSNRPLYQPTDVEDPSDRDAIEARKAYNNARRVVLDDGSSFAYWNNQNNAGARDLQIPYLTADHTVRVGAAVHFQRPLVLDYRFGWKLQPQRQVVGEPKGLIRIRQDREWNPETVGGDVKLASFNMLNYFTTLGDERSDCSFYADRDGRPVTVNRCENLGPRGAWDAENLGRQQAKTVSALNRLNADVVALQELGNAAAVENGDRDESIAALVAALNRAAGWHRWAYVPSPSAIPDHEDAIRTGLIYNPKRVALSGESEILIDNPAFANAREPLAQTFRTKDGSGELFSVVVNHFKSKGCGDATGEETDRGQGCYNPTRVRQAAALLRFADSFSERKATPRMFLIGDFNSYTREDPVKRITGGGYSLLESTTDPSERTYSFGGTYGSIDHIFASDAAKSAVTGLDIWEIGANESVYYQYSRRNYLATNLYRADPFAASDHNPKLVGIATKQSR